MGSSMELSKGSTLGNSFETEPSAFTTGTEDKNDSILNSEGCVSSTFSDDTATITDTAFSNELDSYIHDVFSHLDSRKKSAVLKSAIIDSHRKTNLNKRPTTIAKEIECYEDE